MSPVVAVVGTIAGAGATTAVAALGTALGEQRRHVALVDATAEGSRIADVLDVEGGGDLADALRRGTAIPDVQGSGPHDVAAFPASPTTSWGSMRPDAVATLYDQLRERFEFVLVDCGSDLSPARSAWLGHADEVVVVTDPDVAGAVPETAALAGVFDVPVRGVLASRVLLKEVGDAVDALGASEPPVLGVLPENPTVGLAADAGDSVLRTEPDSAFATVAWELALRFRQRDHDEPVVPAGTGPSPTSDADDPTPDADDPTSDADDPTSDAGDPTSDADEPPPVDGAPDADRADAGAGGSRSTTPEPAPPADDVSAPSDAVTGTVDSESVDPAAPTVPDETEASRTGGSDGPTGDTESDRLAIVSDDEDPFTSPEPRAVEDDEADPTDGEGGASGGEPQGSLLGDVRAHIEDGHPDERAAAPGTDDGPGFEPTTDTDGTDDASDPGPACEDVDTAGDPTELAPAAEATDDDDPDTPASLSDTSTSSSDTSESSLDTPASSRGPAASSPGSTGDEQDRDSDADGSADDSPALSDEEIESLFAETMERVKERRESEDEESEDGTEEDEEK